MNFFLNKNQKAFLASFEAVCRERIAPRAAEADRRGALPEENWRDLARAGYFGLFHPADVGGTGADGVTLALAMQALGRACASTMWAATVSTALCGKVLYELGTEEHRRRWLEPIVRGGAVGCFAVTEGGAGSDPNSYQATLKKAGGGYLLNGQKRCISNGPSADVAAVLARLDGAPDRALCYAVVDLRQGGVERSTQDKLGLRAMPWGGLRFVDVPVSPGDVIQGAHIDKVLSAAEWGQCFQSACAVGLAEAALDAALEHVRGRDAFGRPLAHLQAVQARLADMRAEIDAARLLTLEAAWLKAGGRPARETVMMAKIYATEMAVRAADSAMRLLGAWGYSTDYPVERIYRDSLANVPGGLPTDRLRELLICPEVGASPWAYEPFDWLSPAGLRI